MMCPISGRISFGIELHYTSGLRWDADLLGGGRVRWLPALALTAASVLQLGSAKQLARTIADRLSQGCAAKYQSALFHVDG